MLRKTVAVMKEEEEKGDVRIGELEDNLSRVTTVLLAMTACNQKIVKELDIANNNLVKQSLEIDQLNKLVESQRTELEDKVAYYVELSKKQREKANTLKSDFEKATVDFNEKLESKEDELEGTYVNFEVQIKARNARLAEEAAKHFDEEQQRLLEARQKVEELQSSIENLTAERDCKIRQHKGELEKIESRYKDFAKEREKQWELEKIEIDKKLRRKKQHNTELENWLSDQDRQLMNLSDDNALLREKLRTVSVDWGVEFIDYVLAARDISHHI